MTNDCPRCQGKRYIIEVDKANAYQFVEIPCPVCAASGWTPETPITEGMYLCQTCGRRKYDYRHFGLQCTVCDVEKIKAEAYAKWRVKP